MIRASIGKAVIDIAAPMNSTACITLVLAENRRLSPARNSASPPPSANGAMMPAIETLAALRMRERISPVLNSTPTRNMYSTRPTWQTENRIGFDAAGNR